MKGGYPRGWCTYVIMCVSKEYELSSNSRLVVSITFFGYCWVLLVTNEVSIFFKRFSALGLVHSRGLLLDLEYEKGMGGADDKEGSETKGGDERNDGERCIRRCERRGNSTCRRRRGGQAMAAAIFRRGANCIRSSAPGIRLSHAQAACREILGSELEGIRAAGTWKTERVITSKQAVNISVQGQSGQVLNFCANNYLGLSSHPEVVQAGKEALDKYGAGLSSVRFICGTQDIHMELEEKIAKFHGRDDAILYASCFDANAGLFEILLTPQDAVLSDELNHASIIDGIRLCKAQKHRYRHKDMEDLEAKLQESKDARMKLIVTDGVFSMDGNVAPLPAICELADRYNAMVFIDECHATGFFGSTGRGTEEHFGLSPGRVDIINSTLGKALGGAAGGYTTGPKELVTLLRQRARPYLFSNSIPPPVVACANKVFDLLLGSAGFAEKVQANTDRFRSQMTEAGFTIAGENHPICPVMLGDARLASQFADAMLAKGIYVIGFSYPVVPKGKARIRVQISASHSFEEVDYTVEAFKQIGKELGVIS